MSENKSVYNWTFCQLLYSWKNPIVRKYILHKRSGPLKQIGRGEVSRAKREKRAKIFSRQIIFAPNYFRAKIRETAGSEPIAHPGNTKGGSITVLLTSCLTGLESAVWQLTFFVFICKTDYSKPVKQEVNCTVILPPLVFPGPPLRLIYT